MRDVGPDLALFRPLHKLPQSHLAERRIPAHGLAGPHAEHARALDQQQIRARKPDAAGKAYDKETRAPGNAADAVFKNLAADGIEHDIFTASRNGSRE